ncbi:hypothetical protein [Streptomyces sp. NPDC058657]|uniref:hypothetical protein n=1 Tax=unclassified Streptomyces TaxID=2593676 RepID=UPI00365FB16E
MDAAVRAWLLDQLGKATDQNDLEDRYQREGNARAVALGVLRDRLATLLASPGSINVSGVVSLSNAANIAAYERQIAQLESGQPPAPDDPDLDGDGHPDTNTLSFMQLVERPRR